MRVSFCPNMAVVAIENPLYGEAGLILKQNDCGKVGLLCTLVHNPTHILVSTKVIVGAQNLHLRPMGRMERLNAYNIPHKAKINTDFVSNRADVVEG